MITALPYILRTEAQIQAFREHNAALIRERGTALKEWFNAIPLYEWVPLDCRPGQESATVGLLCILYMQGDINITFSRDGSYVQRGAISTEEHEAWLKVHYRTEG